MNSELTYRPASIQDAELIYNWSIHEQTRRNSLNTELFGFESHLKWFQQKLKDSNYGFYVFMENGHDLGLVRLEINDGTALVSIVVDEKFQKRGFGKSLLQYAERIASEGKVNKLIAQIWEENKASIVIFEACGYEFQEEFQTKDGRRFKQYLRKL